MIKTCDQGGCDLNTLQDISASMYTNELTTLFISAILASYLLKEELGHLGRVGCALCLIGSLIIILHAPEDKEINTVDEILQYAVQPGNSNSPWPSEFH